MIYWVFGKKIKKIMREYFWRLNAALARKTLLQTVTFPSSLFGINKSHDHSNSSIFSQISEDRRLLSMISWSLEMMDIFQKYSLKSLSTRGWDKIRWKPTASTVTYIWGSLLSLKHLRFIALLEFNLNFNKLFCQVFWLKYFFQNNN